MESCPRLRWHSDHEFFLRQPYVLEDQPEVADRREIEGCAEEEWGEIECTAKSHEVGAD